MNIRVWTLKLLSHDGCVHCCQPVSETLSKRITTAHKRTNHYGIWNNMTFNLDIWSTTLRIHQRTMNTHVETWYTFIHWVIVWIIRHTYVSREQAHSETRQWKINGTLIALFLQISSKPVSLIWSETSYTCYKKHTNWLTCIELKYIQVLLFTKKMRQHDITLTIDRYYHATQW